MERRKVLRLAEVLIASQMRSGRSSASSSDFWGRPLALAVVDAIVFLLTLAVGSQIIGILAAPNPQMLQSLAPQVLSFLPLLVLGSVLLAGILFELSASSRFAVSDAANWLPISPVEYVAASAIAATTVYSITAALALGVGVAITWYTGNLAALVLTAAMILLALFEGGLLVEMLRASTQRIGSMVSRRTGRATIALRLILTVLLILIFELSFNPVILYGVLQGVSSVNGWALAIPFLWPSHSIQAFLQGDAVGASVTLVASVVLLIALVVGAAQLRIRFWAPAAAELDLGRHEYASSHPWLAAFGLSTGESSLVWKDLRGLVRRREMIPFLVVPLVIVLVTLLTPGSQAATSDSLGNGILAAWAPGLFALLLSATCLGQERRAIQTLYALPLAPRSVFRAKVFSVLLPSVAFALAIWVLVGIVLPHSAREAVGILLLAPTVAAVSCFVGLAFASRYSDFSERPRPRFLTPSAMIAAIFTGLGLVFAISLPALLWLYSGSASLMPLVFPVLTAALALGITFRLARSGTDTLMRALPI